MEETRIIDSAEVYEDQGQALPVGTDLLGGKFKIDRQIGSGGFGITYLVRDIYLERGVVIKECFPDAVSFRFGNQVRVNSPRFAEHYQKSVKMFMREARSIAKLRHPNIVSVHQVFEENETAYMVLDLIHGRDLMDIIDDDDDSALLSPDQVREIVVKMLDAMDLVHRNDLLHRDISPDNILLDKWGSPTLIDFGAAREDASKTSTKASTMLVVKDGYSPHEFYIAGGKQGPSSDLYALGATMYHLISGESPPNSQTRVAALTNNDPDPCDPLAGRFPQYDRAFLEAIDKAMQVAPKDRVQSASEWLKLIERDDSKVKFVKIPEARSLSKTLTELIAETNKHVYSAPKKSREKPVLPGTTPVKKVSRPEWIEEFNRESREADELQREEEARAAAEAARMAEEARLAEEARVAQEAAQEAMRVQEAEAQTLKAVAQEGSATRGVLDWVPRGKRH
ncbi:serine/threonine protein kinase [Loktanella sp. D2R18]|uniref:serine/threonine protein kinase n=1 Tax=Rhodobacterales TaxID=204455 RepID=UPI000DE83344|nr:MULTISPECIES: serine/threonine-protein kinase [Rhodobacterales]MDO6588945.1 serine/threonine-protein kinase [Yoonia sp. 1_MG-2023]RBW41837.1 serine/threonine protein kinase [Loktanella sp. D2R18]